MEKPKSTKSPSHSLGDQDLLRHTVLSEAAADLLPSPDCQILWTLANVAKAVTSKRASGNVVGSIWQMDRTNVRCRRGCRGGEMENGQKGNNKYTDVAC